MSESGKSGRFVIAWKSKITGYDGQGTTSMPWHSCNLKCQKLNEEFPELEHWPMESEL